MIDFVTQIQLGKKYAIVLCKAISVSGENFCVYLRTKKEGVMSLQRAYNTAQTIHFSDYGDVLWYGFYDVPPDHIRQKILAQC